jgi:hypothetical protein
MGFGKSSGSSTVQLTPEQQQTLSLQNAALRDVFMPAYTQTVGGAGQVYNTVNPAAATAAQTAMDVGQQTGQLQQQVGTGAYQQGAEGMGNMAAYQQGLGQGLTGAGTGGLANTANYQQDLMQALTGTGGRGSMDIAYNQAQIGQQLQNQGASGLAALFNPEYKEQQISAAMQPAREEIREQLGGQNAMFGGAGGLGSSRMALANKNLSQLGEQRLATAAATASAGVEAQRQAAANSLMGAGQGALGQSGNIYGQLLSGGQNAGSQLASIYSQFLNAGQGSNAAAQSGYNSLAGLGQQGLAGAQQAAASRIGYAQTPQDVYSKYASVVFGVPQASTTPNYAGTQGGTTSGKGFGVQLPTPKW